MQTKTPYNRKKILEALKPQYGNIIKLAFPGTTLPDLKKSF